MADESPVKTVDLSGEPVGRIIEEKKKLAEIRSIYADIASRVFMVLVIAGIFVWLNKEVMSLVGRAFDQDLQMMQKFPQAFKPSDRVVTANVFMSLIGATVVQVGVAIIAIVSYLFPKKPGS